MKPITFLFNSITLAVCLSTPACLSADNVANGTAQVRSGDPGHQTVRPSTARSLDTVTPERTFALTVSAPVLPEEGKNSEEPDQNTNEPNSEDSENVKQSPMSINRASHLIGTSVKNQNGETLGVIRDVVFKFQSGRVTYVVLEKADKAPEEEANVAVPLSAFTPSTDHKTLLLNVDRARFQNAHGFSKTDLPDMNDPIYGAEPKQRILIIPVPVSPDHPGLDQDGPLDPENKPIPKVNPRVL